jgi:hypothetical protein
MTREEKCKLITERGYTYNPETGDIYNRYGKISNATHIQGYVTIVTKINKKNITLLGHHFAWYCVYGNCDIEQIDHINGFTGDNRICNLRNVTHQQNHLNRTTAKGYYWNKRANKWHSQITLNNKSIHLGFYITEEEAREAYLNAKEKHHIIN